MPRHQRSRYIFPLSLHSLPVSTVPFTVPLPGTQSLVQLASRDGCPRRIHLLHRPCTEEFVAETKLPTEQGYYRVRGYRHTVDGQPPSEPVAVVYGDIEAGAFTRPLFVST